MDHVSLIADPVYPPIQVPYVCNEEYDGQAFHTYPERKGWPKHLLDSGQDGAFFTYKSSAERNALMQNWLFFGLMSAVFGFPIPSKDFRRTLDNGCEIIHTEALQGYVLKWRDEVHRLDKEEMIDRLRKGDECLWEASVVMKSINIDLSAEHWGVSPEIALSISAIHSLLNSTKINLYPLENILSLTRISTCGGNSLVQHRERETWCPNDSARMIKVLSPMSRYVGTNIRRPANHTAHESCTEFNCIADNVDESTYITKHTIDGCNCEHMAPPKEKIREILSKGGVPVIKLSADFMDLTFDVEDGFLNDSGDANYRYMAISHIWADGLGNARDNSLPRCQIEKIRACIYEIFENDNFKEFKRSMESSGIPIFHGGPPPAFWIDTLCVPRDDDEYRALAIARMRDTYTRAEKVLVLDAELQEVSGDISDEEALLRVILSRWLRRVWTFHEAALASDLWVRFSNKLVIVREVVRRLTTKLEKDLHVDPVTADCVQFFQVMQSIRIVANKAQKFQLALMSFNYRTTSRPSDALICLSNLLGLDTEALYRTPVEQRLLLFLKMQHVFPQSIIFHGDSKIQVRGFRWFPENFMSPVPEEIDSREGTIGAEGLYVQFPAFYIPCKTTELLFEHAPLSLNFIDTENEIYSIRLSGSIQFSPRISVPGFGVGALFRAVHWKDLTKFPHDWTPAALVSIFEVNRDTRIFFATYECTLMVRRILPPPQAVSQLDLWPSYKLQEDQKWCIE